MLTPIDFILNNEDETFDYLELLSSVSSYDNSYVSRYDKKPIEVNVKSSLLNVNKNFVLSSIKKYSTFFNTIINPQIHSSNDENHKQPLIPGVRLLSPGVVVFERPPSHQVISLFKDYRDNINQDTSETEYYIPIPWQVYIATYNPQTFRLIDVKMFFTASSLYDKDQPIYAPPIYNFYSNGKLCRPFFSSMEDVDKYPQNINGIIASAFDFIWNSGFNLDITENITHFLRTHLYEQFEPYCGDDEELQKFYYLLKNNHVTGTPSSIHPSLQKAFFSLWQAVPIANISSFSWSPYSSSDFFYQELVDTTNIGSLARQFAQDNDYLLHDYEENDCHCEDCCSEECVDIDYICELQEFNAFVKEVRKKNSNTVLNKSIEEALLTSIYSLTQSRIIETIPSMKVYQKKFYDSFTAFSS